MAIDFIKIDPTQSAATQVQDLIQLKNLSVQWLALARKVLDVMGHMNDGTTFTSIETYYGLPTGKGQTVYDLVNGAFGATQSTFQNNQFQTLSESVG